MPSLRLPPRGARSLCPACLSPFLLPPSLFPFSLSPPLSSSPFCPWGLWLLPRCFRRNGSSSDASADYCPKLAVMMFLVSVVFVGAALGLLGSGGSHGSQEERSSVKLITATAWIKMGSSLSCSVLTMRQALFVLHTVRLSVVYLASVDTIRNVFRPLV